MEPNHIEIKIEKNTEKCIERYAGGFVCILLNMNE